MKITISEKCDFFEIINSFVIIQQTNQHIGAIMMDIEKTQKEGDASMPWVEKYRPTVLNDLIAHEAILSTLRTFIGESNLPNLLFYGPPGTGKTSTIKALARQFYQGDYNKMVLQFNASDERGIEVVRNEIKSFAANKTLSRNNNLKLIVLDEADMMTSASQFALRRIIEKCSSNARFCLISNYVSKVIPALQSRCTRFKFKQIPFDDAFEKMNMICRKEGLNVDLQGCRAIFHLCEGDMRRVVNMLQSLSMMNMSQSQVITETDIYNFTSNPSPSAIEYYLRILLHQSISQSFRHLQQAFKQNGISMQTIIKELYLMLLNKNLPEHGKKHVIKRLGEIEYRLSIGGSQKLALGALIGSFSQIRTLIDEE